MLRQDGVSGRGSSINRRPRSELVNRFQTNFPSRADLLRARATRRPYGNHLRSGAHPIRAADRKEGHLRAACGLLWCGIVAHICDSSTRTKGCRPQGMANSRYPSSFPSPIRTKVDESTNGADQNVSPLSRGARAGRQTQYRTWNSGINGFLQYVGLLGLSRPRRRVAILVH